MTVRNMTADALSGCIAGCISGGEVYGCTVREAAMMCRDGVAGVLAGEMTGGRVSDCKFTAWYRLGICRTKRAWITRR